VAEVPAESDAAIAEIDRAAPTMRTRYLLLEPLGELARAKDATAAQRLAEAIARDTEWPVRARAAEVASGLPSAADVLASAGARDAEPRVRDASLRSLGAMQAPAPAAIDAARDRLANDHWTFVKTSAVAVLLHAPGSQAVDDALGKALEDAAPRVKGAAIVALALRRAGAWRGAIAERLEDEHEDTEVRAAAARALGGLCDAKSADKLASLARALASPVATEDEQTLGTAALEGLAFLHPADLASRIAPLRDKSAPPRVRAAAEKALAARSSCR
jgi:hypothetical protein